jgi:hypothetical protein
LAGEVDEGTFTQQTILYVAVPTTETPPPPFSPPFFVLVISCVCLCACVGVRAPPNKPTSKPIHRQTNEPTYKQTNQQTNHQVIDTVELWSLEHQRKISLRFLAAQLLGESIQVNNSDDDDDYKQMRCLDV